MMTVLLVASLALQGRVVEDHSGNPVPSASIRVTKRGSAGVVAELETDGEGRFSAPDLPAADYRLQVSRSNYVSAVVEAPANSEPTVRLIRCGVIAGSVTDSAGQPVPGTDVLIMTQSAAGAPMRPLDIEARAGDDGRFRVHGLPPGRYAVVASYGASARAVGGTGGAITNPRFGSGYLFYGGNTRPQFFTVSGGEEYRGVDFIVQPAVSYAVSGKVETPPASEGRFWLAMTQVDQPALAVAVTEAAEDGSFNFEAVPAGSYDLYASGPTPARGFRGGLLDRDPLYGHAHVDVGGMNVEGISLAVAKGATVMFVLKPGDGCPAQASVRLVPLADRGAWKEWNAQLTAGKQNSIDGVPPGRYELEVAIAPDTCALAEEAAIDVPAAKTIEVRTARRHEN